MTLKKIIFPICPAHFLRLSSEANDPGFYLSIHKNLFPKLENKKGGGGGDKGPGLLSAILVANLSMTRLGCGASGPLKTAPFQDPLLCLEVVGHPNISGHKYRPFKLFARSLPSLTSHLPGKFGCFVVREGGRTGGSKGITRKVTFRFPGVSLWTSL